MKKYKIYAVQHRRKRKGKTNYRKRIKLLLAGKPRLVIRKSIKNITAQIVRFTKKGDEVLATAHSRELEKIGWSLPKGNTPSAYLVGLLIGQKAKKAGINDLILDIG